MSTEFKSYLSVAYIQSLLPTHKNHIDPSKEDCLVKKKLTRLLETAITKLLIVVVIVVLLLATTIPAVASGGKVRGDKAQGSASQIQIQDPPPFQP